MILPAEPVEGVIVVSRGELKLGSLWVVAGQQDAKAKSTTSYVLVRMEAIDTSKMGDLDGGYEQERRMMEDDDFGGDDP